MLAHGKVELGKGGNVKAAGGGAQKTRGFSIDTASIALTVQ
jgi:hypothetical protein